MRSITDTIQQDPRLEIVTIDDEQPQAFRDNAAVPVLATPAIIGGAALVGAGALYGQAID